MQHRPIQDRFVTAFGHRTVLQRLEPSVLAESETLAFGRKSPDVLLFNRISASLLLRYEHTESDLEVVNHADLASGFCAVLTLVPDWFDYRM